jgi:hypothetical protein
VDLESRRRALKLDYRAMREWLQQESVPREVAAELTEYRAGWIADLKQMKHLQGCLDKTLRSAVEFANLLNSTTLQSR